MSSRLHMCLVGAGRMGKLRAPLIYANPQASLDIVVDTFPKSGKDLAQQYHCTYAKSLSEALSTPEGKQVTAIWISTPTFTHKEAIITACASGTVKAIFVEKPVTADPAGIKELYALAEASGVKIMCGFQRRFDPSYIAVQEAIASGKIGKPTMVRVFFGDHPAPPLEFLKKGGDPFMDLAPHDIDFVRWVLQDDPVEVFGTGSSSSKELEDAGVLDNATMYLKFKGGCVCTMMMSRGATYGYDQRCEFFGTKGIASVENVPATSCVVGSSAGFNSAKLQHSFPQRFKQAFTAEISAFVTAAVGGKPWPITEGDCCAAQAIASMAMESCKAGRMMKM